MASLRERHGRAALGAGALILSVLVTLFWYLGYATDLMNADGRTVRAEFAAVPQLQVGDPVRVDGRAEGQVREIDDLGGGRGARVTFDVDDEAGPLFGDARVQLRWKNLLGGSFYLEVDRGSPRAGGLDGQTIPRSRTVTQVEVEDVTSVFRGRALTGLLEIPDELSRALRDPAPLSLLLDAVADASPGLRQGLRGARGQVPDVDLRGMLEGTASTVTALDAPRDELRALVAGAAGTLRTTGGRAAELREVLARGPRVTELTRTTLARLDATLEVVDGLVGRLDDPADDVGPTLARLRPTLTATDALLDRARPLVRALRPSVTSLAGFGSRGLKVLQDLQPAFDDIDKVILPYLAEKDPGTGKSTAVMIGGTAAGFGGSAGQLDSNSHLIRFPASISLTGSPSVYLPCTTALTNPTKQQLLVCDQLGEVFKNYLEYVPKLDSAKGGTP